MTANDVYKHLLEDPLLREKYDLSENVLEHYQMHEKSDIDIIEVIKLIVQGVDNSTPKASIYSQIKGHFNI